MGLFSTTKKNKDIIREQRRMLNRSIRELARERNSMKRDEAKLILEIKKLAKQNKIGYAKLLAKDLVRIRASTEKFMSLEAQLKALSYQMTSIQSQQIIQDSLVKINHCMRSISGRVKLPELNRVIQAFAKESNAMELMSEMMEEALDTVGQTGELEDADEEQIINQVLDEIGVELQDNLVTSARKRNEEKEEEEEFDRQTLEKLKNLRAPQ